MTPDDDDRRDERLAELLEVPPLDDVTRRRLVRRALDEPGVRPRARRAWAVVAAAAVVVVGVFATAVVLRDDGGDTTTAADRDRTEKTDEPAAGADEEAAGAPTASSAYLGDVGEISDPAVLRDRLKGRAAAPAPATESFNEMFAPCLLTDGGTAVPPFATGTYQGVPALIHVVPQDGVDTAFVFEQGTCGELARVPLV